MTKPVKSNVAMAINRTAARRTATPRKSAQDRTRAVSEIAAKARAVLFKTLEFQQ